MTELFIHVDVPNFDRWYATYTSRQDLRLSQGIHDVAVFRDIDNGTHHCIHLHVDNFDRAMQFYRSPNFQAVLAEAGVTNIEFYGGDLQTQ